MARLRWDRIGVIVGLAIFYLCVAFVVQSHAQSGGYLWSERSSASPSGEYVVLYNATGTEILAGTVVMADTVAASTGPQIPLGKGFKTWNTVPGAIRSVIGVLTNNCPSYSAGKILVYGMTNYVLTDVSGMAGLTYLRPSLATLGALTSWADADTVTNRMPVVGQFQRYENGHSLYAYARVDFRGIAAGNK